MKLIDKYIAKKFLGTFFFMMIIIMAIAIIFDIAEKIDNFTKDDGPTLKEIVFDYYINFILYYGNFFGSFIIYISVIWFTSKLASKTEIVPILSSGVSFIRFLYPYFLSSTLLVVIALLANHFVIPYANKTRIEFEKKYILGTLRLSDILKEVEPGVFVYASNYESDGKFYHNFRMDVWEGDSLKSILTAQRARCNDSTKLWSFENVQSRFINYPNDSIVFNQSKFDTILNFKTADLTQRWENKMAMAYDELEEYIRLEKKRGGHEVTYFELEMHKRTSFPFSTYILTLIGVSVSSKKTRGGVGIQLALGFLIVMIFILSIQITDVIAIKQGFNPFWASWISNIIFAVVALYFY